jgi:hypothetical protein
MKKPPQKMDKIGELILMFDKAASASPFSWTAFCQFLTPYNIKKLIELNPQSLSDLQIKNIRNFIKDHELDSEDTKKRAMNFCMGMPKLLHWALTKLPPE